MLLAADAQSPAPPPLFKKKEGTGETRTALLAANDRPLGWERRRGGECGPSKTTRCSFFASAAPPVKGTLKEKGRARGRGLSRAD